MDVGKIGTDIQDNKCSWLIIQALQRVDAKQRKVTSMCHHRPSSITSHCV